jgi:hypothetical protein
MRFLMTIAIILFWLCITPRTVAQDATETAVKQQLLSDARPLRPTGEAVLVREAEEHEYLLLGELHGETDIPQLLSALWPRLWKANYRYIAAEVSPWAATHLERTADEDATPVPGLWTRQQAADMRRMVTPFQSVLWGCDIEEMQPDQLLRQIAKSNPTDIRLHDMLQIVSHGYTRALAPELQGLAESEHPAHDVQVGALLYGRAR